MIGLLLLDMAQGDLDFLQLRNANRALRILITSNVSASTGRTAAEAELSAPDCPSSPNVTV
jgi:hypothetical protein